MSSSERRRVLASFALGGAAWLLAGCFRPMLAENRPAHALLGRVALPEVDDRFSYYLNRSLAERLGEPRSADFRLEVATATERDQLAITQDGAVTRIGLTVVADWTLHRKGEAEPVLNGRAVSQSGYNSTASLFATREVQRDVERRLARDLGERISLQLLAQADGLAAAGDS